MCVTTSRIITLLGIGEWTIVQIAEMTDTPIAKVADIALHYWCGLPARNDIAVTCHTQKGATDDSFTN